MQIIIIIIILLCLLPQSWAPSSFFFLFPQSPIFFSYCRMRRVGDTMLASFQLHCAVHERGTTFLTMTVCFPVGRSEWCLLLVCFRFLDLPLKISPSSSSVHLSYGRQQSVVPLEHNVNTSFPFLQVSRMARSVKELLSLPKAITGFVCSLSFAHLFFPHMLTWHAEWSCL